MGQIGQVVILAAIITCPVFTMLFTIDLNFWPQLLASIIISLGISALIMAYSKKAR